MSSLSENQTEAELNSDSCPTNTVYKTAYEFDRLRINHVMFIKDRQKILVLSLFLY